MFPPGWVLPPRLCSGVCCFGVPSKLGFGFWGLPPLFMSMHAVTLFRDLSSLIPRAPGDGEPAQARSSVAQWWDPRSNVMQRDCSAGFGKELIGCSVI